ncbi:MAG: universal stress protein [Pseudomonadota bacterium]
MKATIKTILYATNMGEHTRPVFRYALNIAEQHNAKVVMLHVIEPLNSGVLVAIDVYMPKVKAKDVLKDGMKKALSKMRSRLDKFYTDEKIEAESERKLISKVKVVSGKAAESIVKQAEKVGADLIVIGSHTSPAISTALIGSTANKVTQLSSVPVLVVPVRE